MTNGKVLAWSIYVYIVLVYSVLCGVWGAGCEKKIKKKL